MKRAFLSAIGILVALLYWLFFAAFVTQGPDRSPLNPLILPSCILTAVTLGAWWLAALLSGLGRVNLFVAQKSFLWTSWIMGTLASAYFYLGMVRYHQGWPERAIVLLPYALVLVLSVGSRTALRQRL